jgi:hypothetical protein
MGAVIAEFMVRFWLSMFTVMCVAMIAVGMTDRNVVVVVVFVILASGFLTGLSYR